MIGTVRDRTYFLLGIIYSWGRVAVFVQREPAAKYGPDVAAAREALEWMPSCVLRVDNMTFTTYMSSDDGQHNPGLTILYFGSGDEEDATSEAETEGAVEALSGRHPMLFLLSLSGVESDVISCLVEPFVGATNT